MLTMRITRWTAGIGGLIALLLGLGIWFIGLNVISVHMLFGIIVALSLLLAGIVALSAARLRVLGVIDIIYAIIVPIFGLSQFNLLPGGLHWLIQVLHMLVGIGAMALAGITAMRYISLKATSQGVPSGAVR